MQRIRDWIFSIPLLAAIGTTLLAFHPLIRITGLFSYGAMGRLVVAMERTLVRCFRICAVRIEKEVAPGYRPGDPVILLANHQSNFDIPLIGSIAGTPAPRFAAHHRLRRGIPVVSYVIRRGGYAPIDRTRPREALRAIRDMARRSNDDGVPLVLFPEGKRARDGELLPFQPAGSATMLVVAPDMPVVPVAIDGAWSLMKHGLFPTPYGHRVRIRFHEPLDRAPGDATDVVAQTREVIAATLAEWRAAGLVDRAGR